MAAMHVKMIMINIFMPMFMILGAILRPSFISLVYILLAFLCAFLPPIRSNASFPKMIYCYSIFCLLITLITFLSQFAYQLYQYFEISDEDYIKYCNTSSIDYWFRQAGFIRVPLISDIIVLRLFFPEIFAVLGALLTFIICTMFPNEVQPPFGFAEYSITEQQETELSSDQTIPTHTHQGNCHLSSDFPSTWFIAASMRISDALIVFMSCFVGALNPSILNLPYFLFFLTTMTWWALYTPLRRRLFNYIKKFFKLYLAFHFMLIFAYQIESFQQILPPTLITARLLGSTSLILPSNCLNWYNLDINQSIGLIPFINFGSILALFYILLIQYCCTKDGIKPKRRLSALVPYGTARTTVESIPTHQVAGDSSSLHEELLPERPAAEGDTVDVIPTNLQLQRITSEVMDRHRIAQMIRTRRKSEPGSLLVEAAQEFLYFCLYHCYVFALLSMMMWAILYHSVFGLIFLIMACAIWALVDSRRWVYGLSPLLLAYTEFLLLSQYVYSMQFNKNEIPSGHILEIIGFKLENDRLIAFRTILLKALFSLPFYILLRLHLREDFYNSLSGRDRLKQINYGTFEDKHNKCKERKFPSHPHLNEESPFVFISKLLTKYWIFLVVFCILINTPLIGENNLFSIGFFLFFVTLLVIFQLSFRFFRATIFGFLTLLITYSSLILIAIYCYQFPGIPELWKKITGFTDAFSHDIGLYDYQEKQFGALFERLIKIIALIVVTMLQLKFFHDPWIKLTKTSNNSQSNMEVTDLNRTDIKSLIMTAFDLWKVIKEFGWRFTEVHLHKFILFILLIVCIEHFCLLNLFPVILIAISLTLTSAQSIILALSGYLSFLFVIRRIYQLHFVPSISNFINDKETNCSWEDNSNFTDVEDFGTIEKWFGLQKNKDQWTASDLLGIILVLILIGIQYCIKYRQINNRKLLGQPEPAQGIFFPDANSKDFDKSLIDCFKFFLNYGFYKFGVEISLSAMAFAAWLRMDGPAAILMGWLFVMMMLPRHSRKILWPCLVTYLIIMLPLEYLMAIGLPHNQCIAYPWTGWKLLFNLPPNSTKWEYLNNNLSYLLSIATYRLEPGRFVTNLKIDFALLAIVAAQNRVFGQESETHPAGSNDSIYSDGKYKLFKENPQYDFIVEQRSFVDFFKYIVFMYGHWISMVMVLCAGLGSTSLFALGYVVLAFWMLWQGNNLYTMRNYSKTLAKWNLLGYYTITIMFCKIILQFVGCVFIGFLNESYVCPIQQLFSIFCSNNFANKQINEFIDANNKKSTADGEFEFSNFQKCTAGGKWASEANIGFDAIAFLFIIFQLRILHSWFFQRSMIEFQCEVIQANRIDEVIFKKPLQISLVLHSKAKRSGDYYMFDYEPESDELVEPVESFVPEVTPGAGDFDKLDPAQLLHTALGKDLNLIGTLDSVEEAEQIKDEKLRMIAAIVPSKKAREIAKRALFYRQHPEQQAGSNLLHQMEEDEALNAPSTSTEPQLRFDDVQDGEDEIPTIRLRKKGSKGEELEIQPAEEDIRKEEEEMDGNGKEIDEKPKSWNKAIFSVFRFIWKIIISIVDFISAFLNRRSREHRYVAYVLHKEKQHLKDLMNNELYDGKFTSQELRDRWESRNMHIVSSEADIRRLEDEAHTRWEERNVFARFITAIGNCICAHTDIICYSLAVYVHGWTAGLITLPLPALVFLWGTLANPRPSKFFWVTMIFYTELEIVIKFAFQFGFWSWNRLELETLDYTKTYKPQYLLGIQRVEYFALSDVALLISLFFHRYMLRKLGLWRDANSDKLLVTPSSSPTPVHSNANGRTRKNGGNDGSAATESTNVDAAAHIQIQETEIDHNQIDVEAGENKQLSQNAEKMPPSGNPATSPTKIPTKIADMNTIGRFITKLIYPKFRYIRDFYPLMFFLDVFSMFVVAINYSSFGEGGSGDVVSDIKSNRVPIMLVVILLIQSLMIVVDRGLYLRKAVIAKLVYHLFTLVLIHVWIFFILPAFTQKEAFENKAAKFLYFVKCVYFLISAWQIRNGYPSLCIGNLLTHSYGLINMILFKAFMLTPFVFELRTAIDWTWTDTSMPIFDFFNMENFYATIYNLKCARKFEDSFPAPRGEAKGSVIKYMMGLPLILVIILLIWSPIIAFSLINTIGNVSPPESAIMTVSLEGFPPLYKMEAKGSGLMPILSEEYDQLIRDFSNFTDREPELRTDLPERSRMAVAYISQYTYKDILRVKFRPESESFWEISPDSLIALTDLLKNNTVTELKLNFQFEFTRKQKDKDAAKVHFFSQQVKINGLELLDAIQNSQWFNVSNSLPTYFVIPSEGEATSARLLQKAAERRTDKNAVANETATYNKWGMKLQRELMANSSYWLTQMEFNENITKLTKIPRSERIDYGTKDKNYTEFVALVDRVFPSWLNNYVQGGIILMYMGVILVIGRLIRGFISSQPLDVIVNEIPNPDYLLKICLDIYLVREARDFVLEQDLFAKLIFLFRSPQTLIKWTRYKAKPE